MEYLDSTDDEWQGMWERLEAYPLNNGDMSCEHQGHCWEYLGSNQDHHHFRHANHPASNRTEYIYLERIKVIADWS